MPKMRMLAVSWPCDVPAFVVFVPPSIQQFAVPENMRKNAKTLRTMTKVVPDFTLRRKRTAPMRIKCEGEGIQVRRDIAGATRIRVVAPGPPDIRCPLNHDKIVIAALLEANSHP